MIQKSTDKTGVWCKTNNCQSVQASLKGEYLAHRLTCTLYWRIHCERSTFRKWVYII